MRYSFLFLLLPLLLAGCGGGARAPVTPTPAYVPPTAAPVHSFVPGVHRYVDPGGRLAVPTPTPVPTPTRVPLPGFIPEVPLDTSGGGLSGPHGASEDAAAVPPSCVDHYRRMLVEYEGRVPFGSQVAYQLSRELVELRPDCSRQGWSPRFEADLVCVTGRVGEVSISRGLTWRQNSLSYPRAVPTARDSRGNILVHFARMPFDDAGGCWYYSSDTRAWAWLVVGSGSGVDLPRFPSCEALLRDLLASQAQRGFGPLQVVRAVDEVRLRLPVPCGSGLWNVFPTSRFQEGCGVESGTGLTPAGDLVVSWHDGHFPADDAVCWVLPRGSDEWKFHYVKVDEE